MQNILAVFIGGGIGAVLRYMTGVFALRFLSVNFSVYLLLSIIAGLAAVWIGVNFAKVF